MWGYPLRCPEAPTSAETILASQASVLAKPPTPTPSFSSLPLYVLSSRKGILAFEAPPLGLGPVPTPRRCSVKVGFSSPTAWPFTVCPPGKGCPQSPPKVRHAVLSPRESAHPACVDRVGGKLHPPRPADGVRGETALPAGPLESLVSQRGHWVAVLELQGEGEGKEREVRERTRGREKKGPGRRGRTGQRGREAKGERESAPQRQEREERERIRCLDKEARRVRETGKGT